MAKALSSAIAVNFPCPLANQFAEAYFHRGGAQNQALLSISRPSELHFWVLVRR